MTSKKKNKSWCWYSFLLIALNSTPEIQHSHMHTEIFPPETVLSYWAFFFVFFIQNMEAEKGAPRRVCLPHESPSPFPHKSVLC